VTEDGKQLVIRRIDRATTLVQLRQIWPDLTESYQNEEMLAYFLARKEELS
jgi:hypothetical protein